MRLVIIVVLLLGLLPFQALFAQQSCVCESFNKSEEVLDSLMDVLDFSQTAKYAEDLIAQKSEFCKAIGYHYLSLIQIKNAEKDSTLKYIKLQEEMLSTSLCKHSIPNYLLQKSLAEYYFLNNDYEGALDFSLKGLEIALEIKSPQHLAESNLKVAAILMRMKLPERYKNYVFEARKNIDLMPESNKKYMLYNILSNRYINLYQDFKEPKYIDSIDIFLEGIKTHALKQGAYSRLLQQYYRKKAMVALQKKNLVSQINYLDSAFLVLNYIEIKGEKYSIYGDKANAYRKLKKFNEATLFADSSLFFALQDNVVSSIINAYDIVYMVAKDAGNVEKALWAFENLTTIDDSLTSVKNTEKIVELEQKYEKSQNEKTIKELGQEAEIKNLRIRILIGVVMFAAFLLILIVVIYRQRLLKNRQQILETEQRLNRSRINPHFFFNAITTLQGIAVKENDGKKIALNLYKFSNLMRKTLESSFNDYITIEQELDFIHQYIELQQLKEQHKFEFIVDIEDNIEQEEILIPSMIIQPFLENAIEHGFAEINYIGKLELLFLIQQEQLKVIIRDDGKGISSSNKENNHISRAVQITKDRLYLINQEKKNTTASYHIKENIPHGVVIELILPLLYKA